MKSHLNEVSQTQDTFIKQYDVPNHSETIILIFIFRSCHTALKSIQNVFKIGSNDACINLHKATYSMNKTAS